MNNDIGGNGTEFEFEIYEAPGGHRAYGRRNEKGEWDGLIGELVNKKADFALGAISVMAELEDVVDFTVPYYDLVGYSILRKIPDDPVRLFMFMSVMDVSVWFSILLAFFITSVVLWIFTRWSPFSYQNNMETDEDDDEERYFNCKESLWFCMLSMTPQGGGEAPKNPSSRLFAATWWLVGFIIICMYTANLSSYLINERLFEPPANLEQLTDQDIIE